MAASEDGATGDDNGSVTAVADDRAPRKKAAAKRAAPARGAKIEVATLAEIQSLQAGREILLDVRDSRSETISMLEVSIAGTAPMLMNSFGAKARAAMLATKSALDTDERAPKMTTEEELIDKLEYSGPIPANWAAVEKLRPNSKPTVLSIPAHWIKCMMCAAAGRDTGVARKDAQSVFWIDSHVPTNRLRLIYPGRIMVHESIARTQGFPKKPYVNFRPCLEEWSIDFSMTFDAARVRPAVLVRWLLWSGWGIGAGDYRPEKSPAGQFGTFEVRSAVAKMMRR